MLTGNKQIIALCDLVFHSRVATDNMTRILFWDDHVLSKSGKIKGNCQPPGLNYYVILWYLSIYSKGQLHNLPASLIMSIFHYRSQVWGSNSSTTYLNGVNSFMKQSFQFGFISNNVKMMDVVENLLFLIGFAYQTIVLSNRIFISDLP